MAGDLTKNVGPPLTSWGIGDLTPIPTEWLAKIGFSRLDQEVPLGATLDTPIGGIVASQLIQTRTDERKKTSTVLGTGAFGGGGGGGGGFGSTMVSEVRMPDGTLGTETRTFLPEGTHLVLTDPMYQATQKNLGVGAVDQTVLTGPLPAALVLSFGLDPDGTIVTVTKQRKLSAQIVEGEWVTGNVWTKVTCEGETATVGQEVIETRYFDTIPEVVSTQINPDGTTTTIRKRRVALANVEDEKLVGGDWIKIYREGVDGKVMTQVTESRPAPSPNTIPSTSTNQDRIKVETTKRLRPQGDITAGVTNDANNITTTEKKEVSDKVSEEVVSIEKWIPKYTFKQSKELALPPEYRGILTMTESSQTIAGQAPVPVLAPGEIEHTNQQIDDLFYRSSNKFAAVGTLPITQFGEETTEEYGGLLLLVQKTVDAWPPGQVNAPPSLDLTVNTDLLDYAMISAKTTPYGAYGILEKKKTETGFPLLYGATVDPLTMKVEPFWQQVVQTGTAGSSVLGRTVEIKPMTVSRCLATTRVVDSVTMETFWMYFGGTTNVNFPPELLAVNAIGAVAASGSGIYGNSGGYSMTNNGSGGCTVRGEARGSCAVSLDVSTTIKTRHGNNLPCHHLLFFLPGPIATYGLAIAKARVLLKRQDINIWPKWQPQTVTILCVGGKKSGNANADIQAHDTCIQDYLGVVKKSGAIRSGGQGAYYDVETIVKNVQIPPTIHKAFAITGTTYNRQDFSARSFCILAALTKDITAAGYVEGWAYADTATTNITASPGATTIPTSGLWISNLKIEPYKAGYVKVDMELVDGLNM